MRDCIVFAYLLSSVPSFHQHLSALADWAQAKK
jgi:hypothetical protein